MKPDDIRAFAALFHNPEDPFTLTLMTRDQNKHIDSVKAFAGTLEEHAELIATLAPDGPELYMSVASTPSKSLKLDQIGSSWAVVVDRDAALPDLCHPGRALQPTWMVETSAGRSHMAFILDCKIEPHKLSRLAKALACRLEGDMSFARANQLIRVPGYINQKYGKRVLLRTELSSGRPFKFDYLWDACDGELYEARVKNAIPRVNHIQRTALQDDPQIALQHAREAVSVLRSHGHANHYDTWWKVLSNLGPLGADGLTIAQEFSKGWDKYDASAVDRKWLALQRTNTGQLSAIFAQAQALGWKNPGWEHTDAGQPARQITDRDFGARVASMLGDDLVALEWTNTKKSGVEFLHFRNGTYQPLKPHERRAKIAVTAEKLIASVARDGEVSSSWSAHAKKLGNNKSLDEVCDHVGEALVGPCTARLVSGYPYLPVANGVLNLLNHELVPAKYWPISRVSAPVLFDPSAKAERFSLFLLEIFSGDQAMVSYVMRILGYALLGKPVEHMMFIFLGPTSRNGKTTLITAVKDVLGEDLVCEMKTEVVMQKSHVSDGANPALAVIKGARIVQIAEPNRNHKLDTSLLKQLTGQPSIFVRGLYSDGGSIPIQCAFIMDANFMPFAEAQDPGMWNRIQVVPFNRHFRSDERDRNLREDLKAEASGILNMLLSGLADYQRNGLMPPLKSVETTLQLQKEADSFKVFIAECFELDNIKHTKLKDIWAAYQTWANNNPKYRYMSKNEFIDRLDGDDRLYRTSVGNLPAFTGLTFTAT